MREGQNDLPVTIKISEPWCAEQNLWYCAVSVAYPGKQIETWASDYDAIGALGKALFLVRVQQRYLLRTFAERLIWPLTMKPIQGSEFEDVAML